MYTVKQPNVLLPQMSCIQHCPDLAPLPLFLNGSTIQILTLLQSLLQMSSLQASLVVQWLRIRLARQATLIQSLVREISPAVGQLSPRTTTAEPML